jgi:hypothetical protein
MERSTDQFYFREALVFLSNIKTLSPEEAKELRAITEKGEAAYADVLAESQRPVSPA